MRKLITILFAIAALGVTAHAQLKINDWDYYNYPWHPSGGTSTGGTLSLTGTMDHPYKAATMNGGTLTAWGGYWLGQGLTLPRMTIQKAGTNVIIRWPDPSTRYRLFESGALTPFTFTPITTLPAIVGSEKQVAVPQYGPHHFFQLYKPW